MLPDDAVRFDPAQPLQPWGAIPTAGLESGSPQESGHLYIDDKARGLSAGIWHCEPMVAKSGPYPVDEFMLLLDGVIEIATPDGAVLRVEAGEAFVLPKGLVCQWRQPGPVKKVFVILETPGEAVPSAGLAPIKIDTGAAMAPIAAPAPESLLAGSPAWNGQDHFVDATGKLSVGLWDTTAYHRKQVPFPRHELMCLLEGEVSIAGPGGGSQSFAAGDAFFVPHGAVTDFKTEGYLKKIYVILKP